MPASACKSNGFTLVEAIVSTAVAAIVMVGMVSAVVLATRALPDENRPPSTVVRAAQAADRIASELVCAQSVTEWSDSSIAFVVADRTDPDAEPEQIRYAWSGVPGEALTRQYNAGDSVDFLANVHEFALNYKLKQVTRVVTPEQESPETYLIGNEDWGDLRDFSVDADHWIGQFFQPDLPPETVRWRVTRVRFLAKSRGETGGLTMVQLRPATPDGLPADTVLEQVPMYESELTSSYLWQEVTFSGVSDLEPGAALCLVLACAYGDPHSCKILYQEESPTSPGTYYVDTSNGGASWDEDTGQTMLFHVYGTITTLGEPQTVYAYRLTGVEITLRVGDQPAGRVQTSVQILNAPEVTGP